MMQCVACYQKLNQVGEAKGTLENAKSRLALLPDVDFAKTTRYSRDDWNKLLTLLTQD